MFTEILGLGSDNRNKAVSLRKETFIITVLLVAALSASLILSGPISSVFLALGSTQNDACTNDPRSINCKKSRPLSR